MYTLTLVCTALLALWLLHRLFLWMERRGWIFYLHKKPDPASLGSAFLQIHQLAEPQKKYIMEAQQSERAEHEDATGGDEPGSQGDEHRSR